MMDQDHAALRELVAQLKKVVLRIESQQIQQSAADFDCKAALQLIQVIEEVLRESVH